jgi:glycosyltransferase involved in cell wall biosynthesis
MISVVVPTLISNDTQLQTTNECIRNAREKTELDFELVVVETLTNYFASVADTYIHESKKTTATKSINRGFYCASGDKVVLLTNDVIVDDGWLEHLLECFKISDCGMATLATDQFAHPKQNKIEEGIWFSVAMVPKAEAWFDEAYKPGSWDDSDLIMRNYLQGRKMYRSYKSVVHHKIGMTHYEKPDHKANFDWNKQYFSEKYKDHADSRIFKILVRGVIL